MTPEHAEIWLQTPPAPIQHIDTLAQHPAPHHTQEKVVPDDLRLLGMMLYMEQGLVLEWLHPRQEKETEETNEVDNLPEGKSHD